MTTFDNREQAFEKKHAHDEELAFKVTARRNKLFGLWIAGEIGLSGDAADAYAKDVILADLEKAGDDDVIGKVTADLKAKGKDISEHRLRAKLAELAAEAQKQLSA